MVRKLLNILFSILFAPMVSWAAPNAFSYQGQIIKPNGQPLEGSSVTFTIEVLSPGVEACLLYEETHTLNMSNSNGIFSFEVGAGARSGSDYEDTSSLASVFDNTAGLITPTYCASVGSYTPVLTDSRKLRITFDDGTGPVTLAQDHNLVSVPFATSASSIDGLNSADLLQINTGGANELSQANLEAVFTTTNRAELMALLGGTSSQYVQAGGSVDVDVNSNKIVNLADPTSANDAANKNYVDANIGGRNVDGATIGTIGVGQAGQVLTWDGNQWTSSAPSGDSTKLPLAGGTMSGNIAMGSNDITGANDITLTNDLTVGNNVSITGGIGVGTGINSAGTITAEDQSIIRFGDSNSSVSGGYVGFIAPTTVASDVTWTLPDADGSAGQILSTNGSGTLSWVNDSSPVTSVFTRTGAITAQASDYDAVQIDNTPAGNIVATNVQAAINELDGDKVAKAGDTMTGDLVLSNESDVRFGDSVGGEYAAIQAPNDLAANYTLTLPADDGASGEILQTDGSGVLSWTTAASGTITGGTNVGTGGEGPFKQVNGANLEFKNINAGSTKVTVTDDAGNDEIDIDIVEANIDHDSLSGFVANEHIDHSGVNINTAANSGLSGGGDISASRSLAVDVNNATAETVINDADSLLIYDASATGTRKITRSNFLSGYLSSVTGETLADSQVWVGNGSNQAAAVAISGDATIANTGALTIANNAVTTAKINNDAITSAKINDGEIVNADISASAAIARSKIASGTANRVLITDGSGVMTDAAAIAANRALASDANGIPVATLVTDTELGYLDGVTSAIQTQLDGKQASLGYTPVDVAGDTMTGNLNLDNNSGLLLSELDANGTDAVTIQSPSLLAAPYTLTLPVDDGASGQVLQTDGTGVLSWVNQSTGISSLGGQTGGTQTFAAGSAGNSPAISSAGNTHTLNVPLASAGTSVTSGTISNADYVSFSNKLDAVAGETLADSQVWVGNGSNQAAAVAISGDATIANTGALTIANNAVTTAKINNDAITSAKINDGEIVNADISASAAIARSKIASGTANRVLITDGSGVMTDAAAIAANRALASDANGIPVATLVTDTELGYLDGVTSAIQTQLDGKQASLGYTPVDVAGDTMTGDLVLSNESDVRFGDSVGGQYAAIQAPNDLAANYTLTLPDDDGTSGQVLQTDGSGVLSWVAQSSGADDLGDHTATATLNLNNNLISNLNIGDATSPSISFNGDGNTGIFSPAADSLSISTAGSEAMTINSAGDIGIGTTTPDTILEIAGTLKLADGSETCTVGTDGGMIRYNGTDLQYCNGSAWQTLGISGAGLTSLGGQTGSTQTFAAGSAGNSPAISSAGDTHTLNVPLASAGTSVTSGTISNADYVSFSNKLDAVAGETLADSQVWVGNGSNVAAAVAISGDATIANTGALTIANNAVTTAKINNDAITSAKISDGEIVNADISASAAIARSKIASGTGNRVLITDGSGVMTDAAAIDGNRALASDANGIPVATLVTDVELGYLDGVTSAIQTQLDSKQASLGYTPVDIAGDTMTGNLNLDNNSALLLSELDVNGTDAVTIQSPSLLAAPYTLTLPVDDGAAGEVLQTDGSGVLSWVAQSSGADDLGNHTATATLNLNNNLISNLNIGDATSPSISFNGDGNTGIFSPAADSLSISTAGSEAMTINSAGDIGIGTTTPDTILEIAGTLKVADGSETCTIGADGGMIRYNGTSLQYCNGSAWQTLGISGAGLTSLGGQTGSAQTFAAGSAGNAPAISSAGNTHTLNVPLASAGGTVTSGTISNADYVSFSNKLDAVAGETLADSQVWVGNGSNVAAAVAISGDATIANTGALTIANNAVTTAKINNDAITSAKISDGEIVNADISASAAIARSKIASGTGNRVLITDGSGVMTDAAAIDGNRALASDANGIPVATLVTDVELGYLDGVTSAIQTQLDSKQASLGYTPVDVAGDTMTGNLNLDNNSALLLSELDVNGTDAVTIQSPSLLAAPYTLTLPVDDGDAGEVLQTNGSGVLSWVAQSSGADDLGNHTATATLNLNNNLISNLNLGNETSPSISFNGDSNTGIFSPAGDSLAFSTAGNEALTIDNAGNVGIGSTTPSSILNIWGNSHARFNRARTNNGTSSGAALRLTRSFDGGVGGAGIGVHQDFYVETSTEGLEEVIAQIGASATDATAGAVDSDFYINISNNGAVSEALRINNLGSVGIGTTSPDTILEIAGTLKVADGSETCTIGADGGMIRYNGTSLQYCNGSAWQTLGISGAGLTSLGGQTGSTQTFAAGSAGNAPAISSAGNTHTLNVPLASAGGTVTSGTISNADYVSFSNKLDAVAGETLADSQIWVGNGSNVAAAVAISGDATLSNSGALTIAGNAITSAKISDGEIVNADISATAAIARSKIASGTPDRILITDGSGVMTDAAAIDGNRALASDANGIPVATLVTDVELGYLDGVTSAIQTQLDGKQASLGYTPVDVAGDTMTGNLNLDNNSGLLLSELDVNGTDAVTIQSPSLLAAPYTLTLPVDDGDAGEVLQTDGSGVLSWVAQSSGADDLGNHTATATLNLNNNLISNLNIGDATSPSISFNGDSNTGIFSPAGDSLAFSTAGIEAMSIDSSGNLGIGTTSPFSDLHLRTSGTVAPTQTADMIIQNDAGAGNTASLALMGGNTGHSVLKFGNRTNLTGEIRYQKFTETLSFTTNNSERLRIDSSGNVGIGTTTPSFAVALGGDADKSIGMEATSVSGSVGSNLTVQAGAAAADASNKDGGKLILSSGESRGNQGSMIEFFTADSGGAGGNGLVTPTRKMVLNGNGFLGLNDSSPESPLTATGGDLSIPTATLKTGINDGTSIIPVLTIKRTRSGGSAMSADSGARLDFELSAEATSTIKRTTSMVSGWETAPDGVATNYDSYTAIETMEDDVISEKLRITAAGQVGIGTTTPDTILEIAGTLKVADGSETCSAGPDGGMIRYNGTSLQYCNGSAWQTLGVSGAGLTSLGGQTGSTQTFAAGSAGNAPAISSAGNTHTLNVPLASAGGTVTSGTISNADYVSFSNKLDAVAGETLADSQVWVGNGSNVAAAVAISGDATIANTGALTIANNAVTTAKINNDAITSAKISDGEIVDADISASAAIARSKIASGTGNRVLITDGSGVMTDAAAIDGNRALASDANGIPVATLVTDVELGYLDGVTSAIQTQLNGKQASLGYTPVNKAGDTMTGNLTIDNELALRLSEADGNGANYVALKAPNILGADYTLTLPVDDGAAGEVLQTDGSGVLSWTSAGGSGDFESDGSVAMTGAFRAADGALATPSITFASDTDLGFYKSNTNQISFVNGSSTILSFGNNGLYLPGSVGPMIRGDGYIFAADTDSGLVHTGTADTIALRTGAANQLTVNASGNVGIGTSAPAGKLDVDGDIRMLGSTSGYVGFQAPATAPDVIWTLPTADGAAGEVLQTNGSGVLSWVAQGSGADDLGNHTATATLNLNNNSVSNLALGAVGSPALSFNGDTDTGFYSPSANSLSLVTGGTAGLTLASNQDITVSGSTVHFDDGTSANRISSDSGDFKIDLDTDASGTGEKFTVTKNNGATELFKVAEDGDVSVINGDLLVDGGGDGEFGFINSTATGSFIWKVNSVDLMLLDDSGFLGIGTTAPSGRLDIEGGDVFIGTGTLTNGTAGDDLSVTGNVEVDGTIYGDGSGLTGVPMSPAGANTQLQFNNSGSLGADSNLVWDNTNKRLGIGIASPGKDLHVNGTSEFAGAMYLRSGAPTIRLYDSDWADAADYFMFRAGGTGESLKYQWYDDSASTTYDLFTVLSSGNIGIGTTTPGGKLDVDGDIRMLGSTSGYAGFQAPATAPDIVWTLPTSAGAAGQVMQNNGSGALSWVTPANGTGDLLNGGNAGAVTAGSNDSTLALESNGTAALSFDTSQNATFAADVNLARHIVGGNINNVIDTGNGATDNFDIRSGDADIRLRTINNNDLIFITNATERMRVNHSGSVGIGTTAPAGKLDVDGDIRMLGSTSGYVGFQAPATAPDIIWTLPTAIGAAGNVLQTDGSGALSWVAPSAADNLGNHTATANIQLNDNWLSNDGGNEGIRITNDGNVGIGTTAPSDTLAVSTSAQGDIISVQSTSATGWSAIDFLNNSNAEVGWVGWGNGTAATQANQMYIEVDGTNEIAFWGNSLQRMVVDGSGNVGIGTTVPGDLLHVYKASGSLDATFESTTDSGAVDVEMVADGRKAGMRWYGNAHVTYPDVMHIGPMSGTSGNGELGLMAGDATEYVRIDSTGNVGIGTTAPAGKLDVDGDIRMLGSTSGYAGFQAPATAPNLIWTLPTGDGSAGQVLQTNGSGALSWVAPTVADNLGNHTATANIQLNNNWLSNDGGNEGVRVTNDGNVGVGTATPGAKFDVYGDAQITQPGGSYLTFFRDDSAVFANDELGVIQFGDTDNNTSHKLISAYASETHTTTAGGNYLTFGTVANTTNSVSERMRIDSTGNIGIGTTAPDAKLDVNGTVKVLASNEGASTLANTGATVTIADLSRNIRRYTLTANTTITLPPITSLPTDQAFSLTVRLTQDGTGSRTLAWSGNGNTIKWDAGAAPAPSSAAGNTTIYQFFIIGGETTWYASQVWKED